VSSPIISRADVQALAPEQTSPAFNRRRAAATRGTVRADGAVHVGGAHVGTVYRRSGSMAWRARTRGGHQLGLHTSRQEAVGALVRHHEGRSA